MYLLFSDKRGSLMVESIVAINISIVAFLGILGLLSRTIAINKDVGEKYIATYLATEGIEAVKNAIDVDHSASTPRPFNFTAHSGLYEADFQGTGLLPLSGPPHPILFDSSAGTYGYTSGGPTSYTRVISIQEVSAYGSGAPNELVVSSTVTWAAHGTQKIITVEDHFWDWRL